MVRFCWRSLDRICLRDGRENRRRGGRRADENRAVLAPVCRRGRLPMHIARADARARVRQAGIFRLLAVHLRRTASRKKKRKSGTR